MLKPKSELYTGKVFGMTPPISLAIPTREERRATIFLKKTLHLTNVFETKAELNYRLRIINQLNNLVAEWIYETLSSKDISPNVAKNAGGRVYTFGSNRLGIHSKGADIDALLVVSTYINRNDFFATLFDKLKNEITITKCRAVENVFVPVIKMNYGGIDVDLLFAQLNMTEIPENLDLQDDNLLENLDERCVRSLNGFRVANEILGSVPNVQQFRLTLHTIKQWAKKRGIYSNSLGYFGGVSWSILVARTCQLYPNADASTLVEKFFFMYSNWKWPTPVMLKHYEKNSLGFPVWNPRKNVTDQYHLMPIITPAYPESNTTYNVSRSNYKTIEGEIKRAAGMINEIVSGKSSWERLFKPVSFFNLYEHFDVVLVKSKTSLDHVERKGLIESKLRFLVLNLEQSSNVSMVHVNTKCFDNMNKVDEDGPYCSMWFIGLTFIKIDNDEDIDLTPCNQNFVYSLYQQASIQGLDMRNLIINIFYVQRSELNEYLDIEFLDLDLENCNKENNSQNKVDETLLKRTIDNESINPAKRLKISN